jgi:hypothetical protein
MRGPIAPGLKAQLAEAYAEFAESDAALSNKRTELAAREAELAARKAHLLQRKAALLAEKQRELQLLEDHRDAVMADVRRWYGGSSCGVLSQLKHALHAARQAELAGAPDAIVVGVLLHDIGWKLATRDPSKPKPSWLLSFGRPDDECIASSLGILSHFGNQGGSASQLRAQHDTIGGAWARLMGFEEGVAHIIEGRVRSAGVQP